jgi:hypothetical protein
MIVDALILERVIDLRDVMILESVVDQTIVDQTIADVMILESVVDLSVMMREETQRIQELQSLLLSLANQSDL